MLLRSATLADGSVADVRICLSIIDAVAPSLAAQVGEPEIDLAGLPARAVVRRAARPPRQGVPGRADRRTRPAI